MFPQNAATVVGTFCIILVIIQLMTNSDGSMKLAVFQVVSVLYVVHNSPEHERTCTCAPSNTLAYAMQL